MGYFDVANSPLLYVLVAAGVLYIVGLSAVFLRKSWRRCLELGISKEKLSAVARSSAVFTIVPSVSIVIGLFTLYLALFRKDYFDKPRSISLLYVMIVIFPILTSAWATAP